MDGEECWNKIFLKHFSSSQVSKSSHFYSDITSTLLGIKPSHLVDYVPPDPDRLQKFLQEALLSCDKNWTNQDLCILKIEEDVLLVNYTSLVSLRKASSKSVVIWVDVTRGLDRPAVISEADRCHTVEKSLSACFEQLERHFLLKSSPKDNAIVVPLIHHCLSPGERNLCLDSTSEENACSLFGWLLGYPVVYWFDTSKGYDLDMEKLVRYSVLVRRRGVNHSTPTKVNKTTLSRIHFD